MRSSTRYVLAALAFIALSTPAWARKDQMTLNVDHEITVGTTKLPAGEYEVKADEDKTDLTLTKDGKVVADAPGHWVKMAKKADDDQVQYSANRLVEVDFGGSAEAFQLN